MLEIEIKKLNQMEILEVSNFIYNIFDIKDKCNFYKKNLHYCINPRVLIAKINEEIVGHILIHEKYDSKKDKKIFYLDFICVKENMRGNGICSKMLKKIEELANLENISYIEFTSNNKRISAHKCYLKNEYKQKESTIFIKDIV